MAPAVEVMAPTQISGKAEASENAMSVKVLDELLSKLNISKTQDETNAAAINIATFINGPIEEHDAPTKYDTLISPPSLEMSSVASEAVETSDCG